MSTVRPLAEDPAVQRYVATQIATAINERLDLTAVSDRLLPPDLQSLAPTLESGVQGFVATAAQQFTESQAFFDLWVVANRFGHSIVRGVLTGRTNIADLQHGQLSLDIGEVVRGFQTYLVDHGFTLAEPSESTSPTSRPRS